MDKGRSWIKEVQRRNYQMKKTTRRKLFTVLGLMLVIAALFSVTVFAEEVVEEAPKSSMYATFWALVPPIVAIGLALITKEVYSSLFIGILVGALFAADFNFEGTVNNVLENGIVKVLSDPYNVGILVFLVILGTMVALMIRAGGSKAYGDWAVAHIKTKSGALWATFILAIVLGVDDYFNNLTTGNVMRPVADGHHISRAKLSYMCDATAAPVCIMMPISSWAAAVTGVINNEELGFQIFLRAIPYNYYAILTMVFIIVMTCMNIDYGPMKTHEDNAAKGDLYTTEHRPYADASEMKFNPNGKVYDLVIPVIILIICCVSGLLIVGFQNGGRDIITAFANTSAAPALALGGLIALIINMIFFAIRRSMSFTELMDCLPEGFKQMVPAILILCLAWTIGDITKALGAPEFVAGIVEGFGSSLANFLPAVVFVIAAFLGFATGTSWGTFGILIPITMAIFPLDNPLGIICISASMAGAVCGDHCSPISDTTIMASAGAQCDHVNHVSTQLPYAIVCAAIAFVSYVVAGLLVHFGAPGILALPFGLVLLLGFLVVMKRMGDDVTK